MNNSVKYLTAIFYLKFVSLNNHNLLVDLKLPTESFLWESEF